MKRIKLRLKLMNIALLSLFTFICAHTSYVLCAPSDVYIDTNNILMVAKPNDIPSPFVIKGVSWSPATRAPQDGPNPLDPSKVVQYGFFFEYWGISGDRNPPGHEVLNYWLKNQLTANYLTDIPLIRQMNANTVRIYHSLGSSVEDYAQVATEIKNVLDEFYRNGIMVIMTVAMSKTDLDTERYLEAVNAYKDHPAILIWSLGNEWNLNKFYGFEGLDLAAAAVDSAAQKIKAIDSHHPVSSVLGDVFDNSNIGNCSPPWTITDILQRCPSIDVWGLNVYRGNTFGNLFEQWGAQFINQLPRPFYISEFGIDSFDSTAYASDGVCPTRGNNVSGDENQQKQADIDAALWGEIKSHLSSDNNNELCLGGLLHEFNDELWKAGSYHVGLGGLVDYNNPPENHSYDDYSPEGFELIGGSPDNILNEEHFGLVTADRIPKLAYNRMKIELSITSPTTPVVTDSGSRINSKTQLSASWICSDPESGIVEYQYKITQDSPTGTVIRDWTSTGTIPSVTATGLTLIRGKTYYFAVKAKNEAELGSAVGYSDGIKVNKAPSLGTITPSSGVGPTDQAVPFTTTYSDGDGWQDIQSAYFLINTSTAGKNCFYAYYDQNTNKLYLRNDANTAWLGGFAPGSSNVIENSYAKIACSKTTVSGLGNKLTIKWNVTLKYIFKGTKNMYLKVKDDNNYTINWVKKGTWTIQ